MARQLRGAAKHPMSSEEGYRPWKSADVKKNVGKCKTKAAEQIKEPEQELWWLQAQEVQQKQEPTQMVKSSRSLIYLILLATSTARWVFLFSSNPPGHISLHRDGTNRNSQHAEGMRLSCTRKRMVGGPEAALYQSPAA